MALNLLDFIVLAVYLLVMIVVAHASVDRKKIEGFLVNNRKTGLTLLTLSNIATFVGAGAVVAVVSATYSSGISYGIISMIAICVAALIFAKISPNIKAFGDVHNAHTLGDFLKHRYGEKTAKLFSFLYIFLALLWGALQYVALAYLFNILTGIDFRLSIAIVAGVTIAYTAVSGLIADMLTDFIQFWVMILTFIVLIIASFNASKGINAITSLPASYFDPLAFGGLAFFIGGTFLSGLVLLPSVHYWQRIYSAESVKTAKKSFLLSIPGIILFVGASIFLGLISVSLLPNVNPDKALFQLMEKVLPNGFLGLGFAGILAVIMSSVDSLLIGATATIVKNIYPPFNGQNLSDENILKKAHLITIIFGILMMTAAFILPDLVKLSLLVSFVALCFVPAILGGLLWKRANQRAAIASIVASLIVLFATFPFIPKTAFLPSFIIGTLALVSASYLGRN